LVCDIHVSPARAGYQKITSPEKTQMKDMFLKLSVKLQLLKDENGQDLIEYALVVALIAFAATAGMSSLATSINAAFGSMGTKLATYS
jgi:pilus assembly protein Flp/PilA